jgi:hypothetical protein
VGSILGSCHMVHCGIHSLANYVPILGKCCMCEACDISFEQVRCSGRLAQVASDPFGSFPHGFTDAVVACLAGDLDLVPRDRRRHALYVLLVSGGLMRQFRLDYDRSDYGPVVCRRNVLEKIITFLA